ncbi:hypothetical protein G4Y79_12475 [Phototrophicus methaneseepsis]|uniref:Uncharacterized protein n=1 Tax=Phototrophicus methaneseepsis TaxID=2710758 RepID=A0A7S8ICH4_9CHLR|nr:hypothetical protein [Phototrophicus methaneseepsis]QPC80532.1 hypothetical protein G4Y79_12475 [Phototrophicus methaneseepsis]
MAQTTQKQGWHVANWGTLGWLETGVKAIGIIVGLLAFTQTISTGTIGLADVPHGISVIIMALLTLFVLGSILLRAQQREVVSLIFAIANALGHAGMLYYLLYTPEGQVLPIMFGIAYVLGELVKQRFLITSGYTEMGQQTPQMLMFSRGLMVVYVVLVVAVLL